MIYVNGTLIISFFLKLEVLRYQDDLETGNTPKQKGTTIADQVDAYRHSLIRKSCAKLESSEDDTTPYHRRGKSRSRSRYDLLLFIFLKILFDLI